MNHKVYEKSTAPEIFVDVNGLQLQCDKWYQYPFVRIAEDGYCFSTLPVRSDSPEAGRLWLMLDDGSMSRWKPFSSGSGETVAWMLASEEQDKRMVVQYDNGLQHGLFLAKSEQFQELAAGLTDQKIRSLFDVGSKRCSDW